MASEVFTNSLTVELIWTQPPGGIERTMQANRDLSSKRAASNIFPAFRVFSYPVKIIASGTTEPMPSLTKDSLRFPDSTEASDCDVLATELRSTVKTFAPLLAEFKAFCSYGSPDSG